jgi:hypothetical protein
VLCEHTHSHKACSFDFVADEYLGNALGPGESLRGNLAAWWRTAAPSRTLGHLCALQEQQRELFGSSRARRASLIVGIVVGALGLAVAVGASAAYLISRSYDDRFTDALPPVVSVETQTHDGALVARDASAMTAPQGKLEEHAGGVGRQPSSSTSATATASASATATASASATALRDNDPPSGPRARYDGARTSRASGSPAKRQPSTSASATASASAAATAKARSTPSRSWWWWRSGRGR